jgi:hypothetical protein
MSNNETATTEPEVNESLFEMFGTDVEGAEEGKWFDFGKTIKVKIRRYKSKKSRKVRDQLEKPYKRSIRQGGTIPESIQEEITTEHIAVGIIADWKGVKDKDHNTLPYTRDNAIALLTQLPEFRDAIAELSLGLNNYKEEEDKELEGN